VYLVTKEQEQDMASKHVLQLLLRRAHQIAVFCLFFILVVGICYCTYCFCGYGYQLGYQIFGSESMSSSENTQTKEVVISQNDTMKKVAAKLEKKGLIPDACSFYILTKLMNSSQIRLVPGHHRLNTSMDYTSLLDEITQSS